MQTTHGTKRDTLNHCTVEVETGRLKSSDLIPPRASDTFTVFPSQFIFHLYFTFPILFLVYIMFIVSHNFPAGSIKYPDSE